MGLATLMYSCFKSMKPEITEICIESEDVERPMMDANEFTNNNVDVIVTLSMEIDLARRTH